MPQAYAIIKFYFGEKPDSCEDEENQSELLETLFVDIDMPPMDMTIPLNKEAFKLMKKTFTFKELMK